MPAIQELLPLLTEAIKAAESADSLSPEDWQVLDRRFQAAVMAAIGKPSPGRLGAAQTES
jgi:DNA-binding GntR family transcriptional regulator